jgi:P-type Ca2+ transporter type 2C
MLKVRRPASLPDTAPSYGDGWQMPTRPTVVKTGHRRPLRRLAGRHHGARLKDPMGTTAARTSMSGLTARQAAERLSADGPNAAPAPRPRRLLSRVARQLADPLVALLIATAVVTTALGDLPDTAVIVLVVTVNTLIGVVQEVRADRAIAALDQLAAPTARVVRDGAAKVVPAADLVRQDVGLIRPADV